MLRPYDDAEGKDCYALMMGKIITNGEIHAHGTDLHSLCDLNDADELFGHLAVVLDHPVDRHQLSYSCSC